MVKLHPNKTPICKNPTGAAIKQNFIMPQKILFCDRLLKSNSGYPPGRIWMVGVPKTSLYLSNIILATSSRLWDCIKQETSTDRVRGKLRYAMAKRKTKRKNKGEKEKKLSPDGQGPKKDRWPTQYNKQKLTEIEVWIDQTAYQTRPRWKNHYAKDVSTHDGPKTLEKAAAILIKASYQMQNPLTRAQFPRREIPR